MDSKDRGNTQERSETWKNKFDYLISIVGMMIGLGNVWRFPYLCYKNGGGAFLIPYFLLMLFAVWPMVIFEAALGQFSGQSSVLCWTLVPLMKGIGYLTPVLFFYLNISYPVVLAWSFRWFLASFSSVLPWTSCNNTWNTDECVPIASQEDETVESSLLNMQAKFLNTTDLRGSSTEEFWKFRVLGLTSGIEDLGAMNWELLGLLAVVWILTYFAIWKGIGWTSKIVYVTASLPMLMIIVVLVRGVTLPGSVDGINYYLKPNMTKLLEVEVWTDAASQVAYSCSVIFGTISSMSRYNKFNHNFFRDSIIFVCVNASASFVSGFAIFSILGFLAEVKNTTIDDVVESGPGLVFVAYPTALSFLPFPQLWSVIFFLTLVLLGFDSQFICQEAFTSCLTDLLPRLYNKLGRERTTEVTCFLMFLPGVLIMMQGGIYIFNLYDQYALAGWCLFFIATFEALTIGWIYGADTMCDDIEYMLGYKIPRILLKICWKFITPSISLFIFLYSSIKYQPLKYDKTYVYPTWANVVGWMMALSSMMWIPGNAIYQLWKAEGSSICERIRYSIKTPINWKAIRKDGKESSEEIGLDETGEKNEGIGVTETEENRLFI